MTGQLSSHPYHWWRASQSRTVSWLGQPSTTTPALEGLVVTPAQINSSASNRRRHQRPGSWSTHSETAGSAQAEHIRGKWILPECLYRQISALSSPQQITSQMLIVFFNEIYLSHSSFSTYIPNNAVHYSFWDTNLFFYTGGIAVIIFL